MIKWQNWTFLLNYPFTKVNVTNLIISYWRVLKVVIAPFFIIFLSSESTFLDFRGTATQDFPQPAPLQFVYVRLYSESHEYVCGAPFLF